MRTVHAPSTHHQDIHCAMKNTIDTLHRADKRLDWALMKVN